MAVITGCKGGPIRSRRAMTGIGYRQRVQDYRGFLSTKATSSPVSGLGQLYLDKKGEESSRHNCLAVIYPADLCLTMPRSAPQRDQHELDGIDT